VRRALDLGVGDLAPRGPRRLLEVADLLLGQRHVGRRLRLRARVVSAVAVAAPQAAGDEQHHDRDRGDAHDGAEHELHALASRGARLLGLLLGQPLLAAALLLFLAVRHGGEM
jgi:hypothetical protein